ncbi:MAG: hypothetical protein IKI37_00955 [Oscillospiraceae bacterium]|nr:hypothetical protein [Oscillospiraceae bacterium]
MDNKCPCEFYEGCTCFGCYLKAISRAVSTIAALIASGDLDVELTVTSLKELSEIEQSAADFIDELKSEAIANEIAESKKSFIESNELVIAYLEKIQSQGYNFAEFATALKLENETLKEEIHFL